MLTFCRLCAEKKEPRQIKTTIDDGILQIKAKLIDCCRWHLLTHTEDERLPRNICVSCVEQLDRSWEFAQCVAQSQTKLRSLFSIEIAELTKLEPNIKIDYDDLQEGDYCNDLFVEIIPSPESTKFQFINEPFVQVDESNCDDFLAQSQIEKRPGNTSKRNLSLDRKHECGVCGRTFTVRKSLKVHMRIHTGERPYPCTECDMKFSSSGTRKKHLLRRHGIGISANPRDNEPTACDACNQLFDNRFLQRLHMNAVHAGERPYPCTECNMKFALNITRKKHMLRLHGIVMKINPKDHTCNVCYEEFETKFQLDRHIRTKHETTQHRCEECDKVFSHKKSLRVHMVRHSDETPYCCYLCGKASKALYDLKKHMRVHTGLKPYPCSECDMKFALNITRKKHLLRIHGIGMSTKPSENVPTTCNVCNEQFDNIFKMRVHMRSMHSVNYKECPICLKIFKSSKNRRRHMMTHSDAKPYCCYLCKKAFKGFSGAKKHMRSHTEFPRSPENPEMAVKRSNICEICGASFAQSGGLLMHMTVHSDDRPYKCDLCDKGFKRKDTLRKHRITHTDPMEQKCTICNKAFRKKYSLKRHMEYHSGVIVKPFACEYCDKAFRERANLVEHIRIHTGEKPHHCESCDTFFRTISSYYGHLRKIHGISMSARNEEALRVKKPETA